MRRVRVPDAGRTIRVEANHYPYVVLSARTITNEFPVYWRFVKCMDDHITRHDKWWRRLWRKVFG